MPNQVVNGWMYFLLRSGSVLPQRGCWAAHTQNPIRCKLFFSHIFKMCNNMKSSKIKNFKTCTYYTFYVVCYLDVSIPHNNSVISLFFSATRSPLVLSPLSWTQCTIKRAIPFQVSFVFLQNQYVGRLHAPPDAANPTENYLRPHFRVPLVSRVGHFQMREDAPARGVNQTTTHGFSCAMKTQPFPRQRGKYIIVDGISRGIKIAGGPTFHLSSENTLTLIQTSEWPT